MKMGLHETWNNALALEISFPSKRAGGIFCFFICPNRGDFPILDSHSLGSRELAILHSDDRCTIRFRCAVKDPWPQLWKCTGLCTGLISEPCEQVVVINTFEQLFDNSVVT